MRVAKRTASSSTGFSIMEELWFGDFSDKDAEQKAASSLVADVTKAHGIRPFPDAAAKLIQLANDPNAGVADMTKVVETDASLAARILQVVNSAAFALRLQCTSVSHAVRLLGPKLLREIATALAIHQMYPVTDRRALTLRDHGTATAGLSRFLATRAGVSTDDVWTCGLLHDLGKLLLLQVQGKAYGPLVDGTAKVPNETHLLEREKYGYDHAVLAGHLLSFWKIPQPIPNVVAWHHQPSRAYQSSSKDTARLVSLVRLADAITYELRKEGDAETRNETVERLEKTEAAQYLNISASDLSGYWDDLHVVIRESKLV